MANSRSTPHVPNFDIVKGGLRPTATHYLLFNEDEDDGEVVVDAHVLDLNGADNPDVVGVVIFPCYDGWPNYLYVPRSSIAGVTHEEAIRLAVVAYAWRYQDLIGPDEGVAGFTSIFDG